MKHLRHQCPYTDKEICQSRPCVGLARAELREQESDEKDPDDEIVLMMMNNKNTRPGWYLVSGASNHVSCDESRFQDLKREQESHATVANGVQVENEGRGKVAIQFLNKKRSAQAVELQDVLIAPGVRTNFLFVKKITERGMEFLF